MPSANTLAFSKQIGSQRTHSIQANTLAFSKPFGLFANTFCIQQTHLPSANKWLSSMHFGGRQTHRLFNWYFANMLAFSKHVGLHETNLFVTNTLASGKHMGPFSKPIGLLHKHLRQATPLAFIRHMGFQTANWFPGQTFASGNNMGRKPIGLLQAHGP